jgi:hypothetical protein
MGQIGAGKPRPYGQIHLATELLRIRYSTGGPIALNRPAAKRIAAICVRSTLIAVGAELERLQRHKRTGRSLDAESFVRGLETVPHRRFVSCAKCKDSGVVTVKE